MISVFITNVFLLNSISRKIIRIDENRCNGCGACAAACYEGAIEMIDGKAVLTREDYCDGLGDCLPEFHSSLSGPARLSWLL